MVAFGQSVPVREAPVVEAIYECMLEPERWSAALQRVCALGGAEAATLVMHEIGSRRAVLPHRACTDSALAQTYVNQYARINPHLDALRGEAAPGQLTTSHAVLGSASFRASRFYQDWCEPSGLEDLAIAVLMRSAAHLGTVGFARSRSAGAFDAEAIRSVAGVVPHLARAARLGALLHEERAATRAFSHLVEQLTIAAIAVDRSGRVIRANAAGDDLLCEGHVLASRERKLRFLDAAAEQTFHRVLTQGEGLPTFIAAEGSDGGRRLVTVIPPVDATDGHFVVLLGRPQEALNGASRVLMEFYKLTPAEYRVLAAMLDGLSPNEVAERQKLSIATVRTHIRRVLEKTGTSRQADLMCEIARALPPIRI